MQIKRAKNANKSSNNYAKNANRNAKSANKNAENAYKNSKSTNRLERRNCVSHITWGNLVFKLLKRFCVHPGPNAALVH